MPPRWLLSVVQSLHCVGDCASGAEEALGLAPFAYLFGKALFALIQ